MVCTRGSMFSVSQHGKHGNENSPRIIHTFYIMENIAVKRMVLYALQKLQNMMCNKKKLTRR